MVIGERAARRVCHGNMPPCSMERFLIKFSRDLGNSIRVFSFSQGANSGRGTSSSRCFHFPDSLSPSFYRSQLYSNLPFSSTAKQLPPLVSLPFSLLFLFIVLSGWIAFAMPVAIGLWKRVNRCRDNFDPNDVL